MSTGAPIAGKYQLLRPLGKGSMGEVWAALHLGLGREVALKLIYEGSPELAARLKREAQACGRLEHPNIVRVYDFGETEGGDPFLVMELLVGETLADRLARRKKLPPAEALGVALRVTRALGAAHEAGIVHRDLKPANIFLCKNGDRETVKVLDFGVSKLLSVDDMGVTTVGAIVGSPAYMSPEQARALRDIDPRADLWSVGVLLFEMLTGTRPFASPTVVGVVTDILAGPIPTLAAALPGVDPRLDAAVRRCLTRELDQRMPSAAALIETLAPVLTSLRAAPGPSQPPGPRPAAPPRPAPREEATRVEVRPRPRHDFADSTTDEYEGVAPPPSADPDDFDKTLARAPLPVAAHDDDERETAVMQGREVIAFRQRNRPPPPATERLPVTPDPEDVPTDVKQGTPPPRPRVASEPDGDSSVATRLMPLPFGPPAAPGPSAPSAWDVAPTLPRTPPPSPQSADTMDSGRATIPPELDAARRNASQTLWLTVIAGLVLGLVAFAGLSLLR